MASKKVSSEASSDAIIDTKSDLLAELQEHEAEQAANAPEPEVKVLANGTQLSENTVYEDRTNNPEVERSVEYELETVELGNGTILTNVGQEKH
jgi:hypothetical protein